MLRSCERDVAEAGGRLASLAVLHGNPAEDLVAEAIEGGPAQRKGIAQVAAFNIATAECQSWCEEQLLRLFDDPDAAVRREAAYCFQKLMESPLDLHERLIMAFCDSRSYVDDPSAVIDLLEESMHRLPGLTCDVCEKFLDSRAARASISRKDLASDFDTVATLVFRTYQQHQNDEWASRCLELIDRMCIAGIHDVRKSLSEFDR